MCSAKLSAVLALILVQLVGLIQGGTYNFEDTWVYMYTNMDFPDNAVLAGLDSEGYYNYVGRAQYSTNIVPARVVPELNKATYNTDNLASSTTAYEVLVSNSTVSYHWQRSYDGFLEKSAVSVGTNASNDRVYVCRFRADEGLLMGTLYLAKRACIVIKNQMLIFNSDKYEVLVRKHHAAQFFPIGV